MKNIICQNSNDFEYASDMLLKSTNVPGFITIDDFEVNTFFKNSNDIEYNRFSYIDNHDVSKNIKVIEEIKKYIGDSKKIYLVFVCNERNVYMPHSLYDFILELRGQVNKPMLFFAFNEENESNKNDSKIIEVNVYKGNC